MTSPIFNSDAGTSSSSLPMIRRALLGVSLTRDAIDARAPAAVRVSINSPSNMKNATIPAVW